jgi:chromosome partitioning protein
MSGTTKKILVANSKGGCGKTTIATNLAVAFANQGLKVSLLDCDRQASCLHWAEERDAQAPNVKTVANYHSADKLAEQIVHEQDNDSDVIIMDVTGRHTDASLFEEALKASDLVLIPMLASSLDIKAGKRFVADLMTHRVMRATPRPIGVIYNRAQNNSANKQRLEDFLRCLGVPVITEIKDSPVYVNAVEAGAGVIEMRENAAANKEYPAWRDIMLWIDRRASGRRELPRPIQAGRKTTRANPKQARIS